MSKTLPISEVKARLPELVTGVEEREEEIVVTRRGKPVAVLVNYGEYERLKDTLEIQRCRPYEADPPQPTLLWRGRHGPVPRASLR